MPFGFIVQFTYQGGEISSFSYSATLAARNNRLTSAKLYPQSSLISIAQVSSDLNPLLGSCDIFPGLGILLLLFIQYPMPQPKNQASIVLSTTQSQNKRPCLLQRACNLKIKKDKDKKQQTNQSLVELEVMWSSG